MLNGQGVHPVGEENGKWGRSEDEKGTPEKAEAPAVRTRTYWPQAAFSAFSLLTSSR